MKKAEYIEELRKKLEGLCEEDYEDAIRYCEEYFDEAGEGNEEQVVEELGSPSKFAAQIKAEAVIRQGEAPKKEQAKNPKTSMKNVIAIFLGLCALPIALPLIIVAVILFVCLLFVLATLLFAAIISIGAILFSGIPLLLSGFTNFAVMENSLIAFGGGLLCIGSGILLCVVFVWLIKIIIPAFTRLITNLYHKAKEGKVHEKA